MQVHQSRYSGMRIQHNYRLISRAMKQFTMGDKVQEMAQILTLKEHMFRPNRYQSNIESSFYLGRTLGDLLDRHYALFAQNQHPLQLHFYEQHNQFLREVHDETKMNNTRMIGERIVEISDEKSKNLAIEEGEKLGIQDYQEIYIQAMGEARQREKFTVKSRDKNGDIHDYLEVRRPYGVNQ